MKVEHSLELFCRNVARIRKQHSLTQAQMARAMEISVQSLRKIEDGVVPARLTVEVIFNIQKNFNISPASLFTP